MAFSNGYNGDVVSLNYILQTLDRKEVAIPGLTCNPNLSVSAAGETAYFYTRSATSVGAGTVGAQLTYQSDGLTRVDIPMSQAVFIKSVLPHVNFATISADVVGDRVVYESINAANLYNARFLNALYASTGAVTGTSTLTKSTVYDTIIDAIQEFKTINKAKGMAPTAIIVGPTVEALLLKCPEFIRSTELGDKIASYEGVVGKIAGLPVVVAVDLDETTNKIDFILINAEGFGAPQNVNTLYVVDGTAAGFPGGTIIAGEIGHGFKIADNDLILLRKHA